MFRTTLFAIAPTGKKTQVFINRNTIIKQTMMPSYNGTTFKK